MSMNKTWPISNLTSDEDSDGMSFVLSEPLLSDSLGLAWTAFISAGRRPDQPCARMHPSAGRREDSTGAYLRANRADRRRVAGVRVPTIRTRDPCHFDT